VLPSERSGMSPAAMACSRWYWARPARSFGELIYEIGAIAHRDQAWPVGANDSRLEEYPWRQYSEVSEPPAKSRGCGPVRTYVAND
jgi:hypothetical protein